MTEKEMEVLTNIIGAVESGGQIYGQRNYAGYAGPWENAKTEVTVTLGWAQNYGLRAQKLVKEIYKKDKAAFRKVDTAGIEAKLSMDWEGLQWHPTAAEKSALIAIITSPAGKKVQDEIFHQDAYKYIAQAEAFGVRDVPAQMMWAEIQHLGGLAPTQRIFSRAKKPWTVDSIFESLLLDQNDKSNQNQVGDKFYQSRHECCVRWIKQYVGAEADGNSTKRNGQAVVDLAVSRLGKNQYTQSYLREQVFSGYSDCSSLVWKCFERALGIFVGTWTGQQVDRGRRLFLCKNRYAYGKLTQEEIDRMQPGDCIYYGGGEAYHVEMYIGDGKQIGHGSGIGPTIKNCLDYAHSHGVYQVRRFVEDDTVADKPVVPDTWKATGTAVSTGDEVNVRTAPDGSASILRTVNKGNRFEVDGVVINGWDHVNVAGVVGYIYAEYVKADKISDDPIENRLFVGRVTADVLNVRRWYGRDERGRYYDRIVSRPELAEGNLVDVLVSYRWSGEIWYKIRIDGKYIGFVDGTYIEKV